MKQRSGKFVFERVVCAALALAVGACGEDDGGGDDPTGGTTGGSVSLDGAVGGTPEPAGIKETGKLKVLARFAPESR